ncbi:hypothetical protein MMC30_005389 [Trapelia coarctata]|nr:hypothetical protein [Trapelia coarctata]
MESFHVRFATQFDYKSGHAQELVEKREPINKLLYLFMHNIKMFVDNKEGVRRDGIGPLDTCYGGCGNFEDLNTEVVSDITKYVHFVANKDFADFMTKTLEFRLQEMMKVPADNEETGWFIFVTNHPRQIRRLDWKIKRSPFMPVLSDMILFPNWLQYCFVVSGVSTAHLSMPVIKDAVDQADPQNFFKDEHKWLRVVEIEDAMNPLPELGGW